MTGSTVALLVAFVVAAIAAWVFLGHAVATWRAANDRDRAQRVRRDAAVRDAQQRNAKPAPKVSDFPRKSER